MDQINRMGTERIVALLERVVSVLEAADKQMPTSPAPRSRLGGLMKLMRDPQTQETLRFFLLAGRGNERWHVQKLSSGLWSTADLKLESALPRVM